MAIATALISSLFNVTSSQNVPFLQPQQLQCLHHGSTEAYLCSPLSSISFSTAAQMTICGTSIWLQCETRVSVDPEHYSLFGMLLNMFEELEAKRIV